MLKFKSGAGKAQAGLGFLNNAFQKGLTRTKLQVKTASHSVVETKESVKTKLETKKDNVKQKAKQVGTRTAEFFKTGLSYLKCIGKGMSYGSLFGQVSGAAIGALVGGGLCSIFTPFSALPGAMIGAAAGYFLGGIAGGSAGAAVNAAWNLRNDWQSHTDGLHARLHALSAENKRLKEQQAKPAQALAGK